MNRKRCHSVVAAASVRRGGRKTMRMQMLKYWWVGLAITLGLATGAQAKSQPHAERWTEKAANEWYAKHPWLVGSNYTPVARRCGRRTRLIARVSIRNSVGRNRLGSTP